MNFNRSSSLFSQQNSLPLLRGLFYTYLPPMHSKLSLPILIFKTLFNLIKKIIKIIKF